MAVSGAKNRSTDCENMLNMFYAPPGMMITTVYVLHERERGEKLSCWCDGLRDLLEIPLQLLQHVYAC